MNTQALLAYGLLLIVCSIPLLPMFWSPMSRSTRELGRINKISERANGAFERKDMQVFNQCVLDMTDLKAKYHPEKRALFLKMWKLTTPSPH